MGVVGRHIDVVGNAQLVPLLGPVVGQKLLCLIEKALGVVFVGVDDHARIPGAEVVLLEPGGTFGGILALHEDVQRAEEVLPEVVAGVHKVSLLDVGIGVFRLGSISVENGGEHCQGRSFLSVCARYILPHAGRQHCQCGKNKRVYENSLGHYPFSSSQYWVGCSLLEALSLFILATYSARPGL